MSSRMTTGLLAFLFLISTGASALTEVLPDRVARLERELAVLKQEIERVTAPSDRQGAKGSKGERGEQGPPGQKGNKGDPGPPGTLSVPGISSVVGGFSFSNPAGKRVAYTGTDTDGDGVVKLYNRTGSEVSLAFGPKGGGRLIVTGNNSDKTVAYLGSDTDGDGMVKLRNRTGIEVFLGFDPKGAGRLIINGKSVNDYAEVFELAARQGVVPGSVIAVVGSGGRIALSAAPYERRVVGVISGAGGLRPGSVIGSREDGSDDLPVAVSGQVVVRVCLEGGPIEPGDLLVASSRPGVAMRAADPSRAAGAVVGKALEAFGSSQGKEGLVRMMVMLR